MRVKGWSKGSYGYKGSIFKEMYAIGENETGIRDNRVVYKRVHYKWVQLYITHPYMQEISMTTSIISQHNSYDCISTGE